MFASCPCSAADLHSVNTRMSSPVATPCPLLLSRRGSIGPTTRHSAVAPRRSPHRCRRRCHAAAAAAPPPLSPPPLTGAAAAAAGAAPPSSHRRRPPLPLLEPLLVVFSPSRHFLVAGIAVRGLHVARRQHSVAGPPLLLLIPPFAADETSPPLLPRVRGLAGAAPLVRGFRVAASRAAGRCHSHRQSPSISLSGVFSLSIPLSGFAEK
ncbi:hypothetical protein Scep_012158 [Stephania cephalantha]|uniref:Uncharacterized protein n=1 Tax=Stephania cephalantha TaxID=152367 RepID=A0AAP0JGL8_9MAGN